MRLEPIPLILALTVLPVTAQPSPCDSTTGRSVSVHGTGIVTLRPDKVSFTLGVETRHASVAEAYRINRTKVSAVAEALKKKGLPEEQLQTSRFDIMTIGPHKGQPRMFVVNSTIAVTRADPAAASDLLEAGVTAGANQAGGMQFFVGEPGQSQRQGLELAFQDARAKAEALAALSKKTLGDVVCIADTTAPPRGDRYFTSMLQGVVGNDASGGIEIGTERLAFHVSAVFELR
jgi:uncharacterized protein YggE